MINSDVKSNAQPWELEVLCKNRGYLNEVVSALLEFGFMEFEVNNVESSRQIKDEYEGIYTVLIWSCWFHNLSELSQKLEKIEKNFDEK